MAGSYCCESSVDAMPTQGGLSRWSPLEIKRIAARLEDVCQVEGCTRLAYASCACGKRVCNVCKVTDANLPGEAFCSTDCAQQAAKALILCSVCGDELCVHGVCDNYCSNQGEPCRDCAKAHEAEYIVESERQA